MKKLKHYIDMIIKNIKKYIFLSVTITMTFTLLLLYLTFADSNIYNEYKEVFGTSDKISIIFGNSDEQKETKKMLYLSKLLSKEDYYYYYYEQQQTLNQYGNISAQIQFIPNSIETFFVYSGSFIKPVKFSTDNVKLKSNEAIVEENLYKYLKSIGKMKLSIPIAVSEDKKVIKEFNVVGYCESINEELTKDEEGLTGITYIFVSQNSVNYTNVANQGINTRMLICSEKNNVLNENTRKLGLNILSVYNYKMEAIQNIKSDIKSKMVLIIIIYIIFGINLYSSFKNALNERKYEIGVKRAIGASKIEIIKQFFFEGFTITIGNVLLSVWLSNMVLLIYKMYMKIVMKDVWIIYISKYSISIFLIVSIFLSILYSVIFAYTTTKVDVLENIRGE